MTLLGSWYASVTVFKPANITLFVLVTLKSIITTYKIWLKYWWWLLGLIAIGIKYVTMPLLTTVLIFATGPDFSEIFNGSRSIAEMQYAVAIYVLFMLLCGVLVLSTRASTARKTFYYFISYAKMLLYCIAWFFVLPWIWKAIMYLLKWVPVTSMIVGLLVLCLLAVILTSITINVMLFVFDSDRTVLGVIKALGRSITMVAYNLPFYLVGGLVVTIVDICISGLLYLALRSFINPLVLVSEQYYVHILQLMSFVLTAPLLINIVTNFYIKRLHEQFNLYY